MKLKIWTRLSILIALGACFCSAAGTGFAIMPCPPPSANSPQIFIISPKDPIAGMGVLEALIVVKEGDRIENVDVFVEDKAMVTRREKQLDQLETDEGSQRMLIEKIFVGLESTPEQIWLRPGKNKLTIRVWTKNRKCAIGTRDIQAQSPNIHAVIVGISEYSKDSPINPLKYAHKDAQKFYDYLNKKLAIPKDNITLCLNDRAIREVYYGALENLKNKVTKNDTIIFYFSGHGYYDEIEKISYLTCFSSRFTNPESTMVSLLEIRNMLSRSQASRKVLFIDACYIGGEDDSKGVYNPGSDGSKALSSELTKTWDGWKGSFGLVSSKVDQKSFEDKDLDGGGGVFTHFLIKGFSEAQPSGGKSEITLYEAYIYTKEKVKEFVKLNKGKEQDPQPIGVMGDAQHMVWGIREGRTPSP